jgi:hypothetical protein
MDKKGELVVGNSPYHVTKGLFLRDGLFFEYLLCEEEDDPRDDEEVNRRSEKRSEEEVEGTDIERCSSPGSTGDKKCDDWHQDAVHRSADDCVEFPADDNGDGESDDAVLFQESHEFLMHVYLL